MSSHQLKKFNHLDIDTILAELKLSAPIRAEMTPDMSDMDIISYLINAAELNAAIKFLALGLPIRESAWWGYLSAEKADGDKPCVHTQNALKNTANWAKAPSEARRKNAKKLADEIDPATPTSWSSMSIFWSSGSIVAEDQPSLEPEPFMVGYAVLNTIMLAAETQKSVDDAKKYFLKQGLHIAMGGNGRIG